MNDLVAHLWLVPALPLLAAGLTALARRQHRRWAATLAIGSLGLALLLSVAAFVVTLTGGPAGEGFREVQSFRWLPLGGAELRLGWVLDPLSACMLVMVSGVGLLIFIYSLGYMGEDENFTRFFCFLSLFVAAMLGLVIANSLLLLFICWELVGLASYLLIGFWYQKPAAAAAAKKAFITTRIGDVFFLLGLVWLYAETGTLLCYDQGAGCLEQGALARLVAGTTVGGLAVSTAIGLLIFCGAIGKSGQVPLHVWLPDAMEGPTPVSALIHAATMVAAGVFLVARVYPLMAAVPPQAVVAVSGGAEQAAAAAAAGDKEAAAVAEQPRSEPGLPPGGPSSTASPSGALPTSPALQAVTWVGVITALMAALMAVGQTDLKRILAYSTVSQLGYMMLGLGVGGVAVGMFHLITHAFFKALLFLGAGSVIHGCGQEQDIRRLGGLRRFMPVTFATYAVGMMALAGFPLVFSGFWSKDDILHHALHWAPSRWPFYLGLAGVFLTAFYMTRQMGYVFFGELRGGVLPHEGPRVMTVPLTVLAGATVLLSVIGTPAWPWFQHYVAGPEHGATGFTLEMLGTMLLSTAGVAAGVGLGWRLYVQRPVRAAEDPDALERLEPDLFTLLRRKFFVDELYEATVLRWHAGLTRAADWLDRRLFEGLVRAVGYLALGLAWLDRAVDEWVINLGFDQGCNSLRRSGRWLAWWQNGQVQRYLRVLGLALALLALGLVWGLSHGP